MQRSVREAIIDATQRLAASGIETPRADAELLLAHLLGVKRGRLVLAADLDHDRNREYERMLSKRMSRIPLQHITGVAPFRYLELAIGPGALIPRPETEIVVESALRWLRSQRDQGAQRMRVFDLCSGAAPIALAIATELRDVDVIAVEKYADAQHWGRRNVDDHAGAIAAQGSTLQLLDADVTDAAAFAQYAGTADLVISNPPYIPDAMVPRDREVALHDPREALFGGADGFDIVRGLLDTAAQILRPGGLLVIEHADAQGEAAGERGLPALVRAHGAFHDVADHHDLTNRPRYTTALRS